jgi:hypothetical protein
MNRAKNLQQPAGWSRAYFSRPAAQPLAFGFVLKTIIEL